MEKVKMIFTKATVLVWADEMIPWAVYEISARERFNLEEAFERLHKQDRYDIVFVQGGVMKQTIHEGVRANGVPAFKREYDILSNKTQKMD